MSSVELRSKLCPPLRFIDHVYSHVHFSFRSNTCGCYLIWLLVQITWLKMAHTSKLVTTRLLFSTYFFIHALECAEPFPFTCDIRLRWLFMTWLALKYPTLASYCWLKLFFVNLLGCKMNSARLLPLLIYRTMEI